jgi:hypothetical protein
VRQRKSKVEAVPGMMEEFTGQVKGNPADKQEFWAMCQYKIRYGGWQPGRAAHTYKERFGVWPRGLADNVIRTPSYEFEKFVKARLIKYLKSKGK